MTPADHRTCTEWVAAQQALEARDVYRHAQAAGKAILLGDVRWHGPMPEEITAQALAVARNAWPVVLAYIAKRLANHAPRRPVPMNDPVPSLCTTPCPYLWEKCPEARAVIEAVLPLARQDITRSEP